MLSLDAVKHAATARQLAQSGNYGQAFDMYIIVFEMCPELKGRLENEFRKLLGQYNEYLASTNRFKEIFHNFEKAMESFPSNTDILSEIGSYLFKYGFLSECIQYYQQALSIDPGFVAAEKNINSVKNFMVERWHFRMLNDSVRNAAYREALKEVIRPTKETILDIGTGTGLLAVYAHQCSPLMITAVDKSEVMTDIARYVLEAADIEDIVLLTLDCNKAKYLDIGGKRALIICELFDAGLLGENVLQILIHAHEYLTSINGKFLPARAELFVMGVQSESISNKYRLNSAALQLIGLPGHNVHLFNNEPYDCEDIPHIKDAEIVTTKESVFKVDFNSIDDLKEKLTCSNPYSVTLKAQREGKVDAIVAFFNLHLTDNVTVTTDPTNENRANAWQQPIFYNFVPHSITESTSIPFQFTSSTGKLSLINNNSADEILRTSSEMIRFLNDKEYMKLISDCISAVCIYLCQITEVSHLHVLDFCPFPIFGLMMMKRGVQNLTCYAKTPEEIDFIISVFEANKISSSKIKILTTDELNIDFLKNQKYHAIFVNIVELSGDINFKMKSLMKQLKQKCLFPGGLVLPHSVTMKGQMISSPWLQKVNKVDDSNIVTCTVAQFINTFQVSQNFNLDVTHLDYKPLSKAVTVTDCNTIVAKVIDAEIEQSGDANAVLCWYQIQLIESGDTITTLQANSFVDCMAFLADPSISVKEGDTGNIMLCADSSECFKIVLDSDNEN